MLRDDLQRNTHRNHGLTVEQQVMITLRFLASGRFLQVIGDTLGLDKSTVSTVVKATTEALCRRKDQFIKWPVSPINRNVTKADFFKLGSFPYVFGAVGGTHVRIQAPHENEASFVNAQEIMATSIKILCGICEGQHLSKCADHWCPECEEGLCNDCERHHGLSKATRKHEMMSIDDYQKLPADILKIGHYCKDHGRKFDIFCPQHDKLCCPICISVDHESCTGLKALDDVVKTPKTSTLIENLELSIIEIRKTIENIIKDRQQNLIEIGIQRKRFHKKITQKLKRINCLLDKLETTFVNELTEAENKIQLQIQSLLSKLEERNETQGCLQNSIVAIKTHATDLQKFFGCKSMCEQVSKEEKYIESLFENGSLQRINLKCDISENVSNILNAVTSLGSISISYNPPLVLLTSENDRQAQMMTPIEIHPKKDIDEVNLTLIKTLKIPWLVEIGGVDIYPNGKIIIADCSSNHRLIILNQDGSIEKSVHLSPSYLCDETCLWDDMVAVTIFNQKEIKLVNIVSGMVSRTVNTDYICDGITQRKGKLICSARGHGITLHDPNDNTSRSIVKVTEKINFINYITTFRDNIYHTNSDTHTVSCYKTSGEKVWEYKDKDILVIPGGVAVDNRSNIYVASTETHSVVIISCDGKHGRQILKGHDCIQNPRAVQFDNVRNVLIVTSFYGTVLMYKVS